MPRLRRPSSPLHLLRQVAAVGLLGVALVLSLRSAPSPAADARAPTVPVVVAAGDRPAGTVLTEGDLAIARVPPDVRPGGAAAELDPLLGRVLAAPVRAGEPVTDVRLVGTGVTALLPPGQVAAPVRLADLAVAALVRSGDRIDVLATADRSPRAEVVAESALVLAAPGSGTATDDGSAGLLLVAVPPEIAARLAAAATTATLTITLPPP